MVLREATLLRFLSANQRLMTESLVQEENRRAQVTNALADTGPEIRHKHPCAQ